MEDNKDNNDKRHPQPPDEQGCGYHTCFPHNYSAKIDLSGIQWFDIAGSAKKGVLLRKARNASGKGLFAGKSTGRNAELPRNDLFLFHPLDI